MEKLALAISILAVSVVSASAADLAARPYTKAPPPPPPVYDWSGFYIGINGGGGSAHKCWELVTFVTAAVPIGSEGCHSATGGTVGGQIGYRWQASNWLFGVEGQGNWANFRGSNTSLILAPDINRSRIDVFGLLTGQVGYVWNNVLLYVKGGAAVTNDRYDALTATGLPLANVTEARWGGTVGAGFEYGFAQNWSVGVEYDHLFMGNRNTILTDLAGLSFQTDRIRQDVDMGLVRVNYRFGSPGIPKY